MADHFPDKFFASRSGSSHYLVVVGNAGKHAGGLGKGFGVFFCENAQLSDWGVLFQDDFAFTVGKDFKGCAFFDSQSPADFFGSKVAFTKELWIENEDFAEVPPPKFKRLTIGGEVRLMGAYIVKCTGVEKNADGSIAAIHCTADLETGNGNPADGRKVKGTIHWVSAAHAVDAEVRLYDKLFTEANMNAIPEGSDYKDYLNPESVVVCKGCKLEESLKDAKPGEKFQFVRTGFFTPDSKNPGVYNRVVTLRDSFKPAK